VAQLKINVDVIRVKVTSQYPQEEWYKMGKVIDGVHETSRGPYIITYKANKFYPMDVRPSDIDIEDIAHALSLQCRFGGHVKRHYSVGQHSILVSEYIKSEGGNVEGQLRGLLHDASEAYLVDVPRPIKKLMDFNAYREIEKSVQSVIYKKYGLDQAEPEWLSIADNALLAREAELLMANPFWCHGMKKAKCRIPVKTPKQVERDYLRKFKELYA
jgi:uncharacterized protein